MRGGLLMSKKERRRHRQQAEAWQAVEEKAEREGLKDEDDV